MFAVIKRTIITAEARKNDSIKEKKTIEAFIFDDTPVEKTGKFIEEISRIWNHVIKRHILGYQLLVMGLYDGTMFMPINFSLHREKGQNKNQPYGLKPKYLKKQFRKKGTQN